MSDEYTYCVSDESGTAQACIVSNHPLTPAEVDSHISVSSGSGYYEVFTDPVPQNQPWYSDLFDTVTNWVTDTPVLALVGAAIGVVLIIVLARYLRSSDLADDAYDAEDYIEDLNNEAYDRTYGDAEEEYDDVDEQSTSR